MPPRGGRRPVPQQPPPPGMPPPPPPPPEEPSGLYVPWWVFVIVILTVAALTCGMWYIVLANRGNTSAAGVGPSPTPIFVHITSTPTLGAEGQTPGGQIPIEPTATPPVEETPAEETPEPPAVTIGIGSQIVVAGTEGAGLAVRQGPGVSFTLFFVANDGDSFIVEAGPREADGYTWWYIADPADPNRSGWAVQNYMEAQTPGGLQEATPVPEPTSEGEVEG